MRTPLRRAVVGGVVAGALIGAAGLVSVASAATGCATFTDAAGDGYPGGSKVPGATPASDPDLDILGVGLGTENGKFSVTFTLAELSAEGSAVGLAERYRLETTWQSGVQSSYIQFTATRGSTTGKVEYREGNSTVADAAFDLSASTVTISLPVAALSTLVGNDITSAPLGTPAAYTEVGASADQQMAPADTAQAPESVTYTVGQPGCTGRYGAAPAPSSSSPPASPPSSQSPSPAPTGSTPTPTPSSGTCPTVQLKVNTPTVNATGLASVTATGAEPGATVELQGYSQNHEGTASFANDTTPVDRTGTADNNGSVTFDDLRPASNTRLRARLPGCSYGDSVVIEVRAQETLEAQRTGTRTYTFSGRSIPGRPGGLIISLYRIVGSPCAAGVQPSQCPGERFLGQTRAAALGEPGEGLYSMSVSFPESDTNVRDEFVVKTGRDAQNAPGRSNARSLLIN